MAILSDKTIKEYLNEGKTNTAFIGGYAIGR